MSLRFVEPHKSVARVRFDLGNRTLDSVDLLENPYLHVHSKQSLELTDFSPWLIDSARKIRLFVVRVHETYPCGVWLDKAEASEDIS